MVQTVQGVGVGCMRAALCASARAPQYRCLCASDAALSRERVADGYCKKALTALCCVRTHRTRVISLIMSSLSRAALVQPNIRKDCEQLACNLIRVKAFIAKFVSMGYVTAHQDSPVDLQAGGKEHQSPSFICSDIVSFLVSVEKLCPSREAALLVHSPHACMRSPFVLAPIFLSGL